MSAANAAFAVRCSDEHLDSGRIGVADEQDGGGGTGGDDVGLIRVHASANLPNDHHRGAVGRR